ncbi:MAG: DUF2309 domain-containing protein [Pirellulales bacterium]
MPELSAETIDQPAALQCELETADLQRIIEFSCQLLPAQGPITAFAFLNTLEGLENFSFQEGVRRGARLFQCEPYYPEPRYRAKVARGRIGVEDLEDVLLEDLAERLDGLIGALGTRFHLRLRMLRHPMPTESGNELQWFISETDALSRFRADVDPSDRDRYIEQTRHWLARQRSQQDIDDGVVAANNANQLPDDIRVLADSVEEARSANAESWSPQRWEELTLRALWNVCQYGAAQAPAPLLPPRPVERHRDLLLALTGQDSDALVHEFLIRFCAAFADQGMAHWSLPERDRGFFGAFSALYSRPAGPPDKWLGGLRDALARIGQSGLSPLESLRDSLEMLGVDAAEWEDYLPATILALRGWAGMLWAMEVRPDRVPQPVVPGTFVEFLAVRLILDRLAVAHVARETLGYRGPISELRDELRARLPRTSPRDEQAQRAFRVFQLAQLSGWYPQVLARMSPHEWEKLFREIEEFNSVERRRVFHLAFERGYRRQALDAFSIHTRRRPERVRKPKLQAAFCIDAREESFRRHLEEIEPAAETFGAAGFFSVPIYYRGVADANFTALCPYVLRPQYYLVEDVVSSLEETHRRKAKSRKALGATTRQVHRGTLGLASGAVITGGLGVLASIPLVMRVLFPRLTAHIHGRAAELFAAPALTRLRLERIAEKPGPEDDGIGFSVPEMATMGERVLRDIGLTSNFAPLVFFFGHASFCLNNPHKSTYDCGACCGSAGGPNARSLAAFLNDPRVREILYDKGLEISDDTWFVGGQHNTGDDTIRYFDLDLLPSSHQSRFVEARDILGRTCERNAHERCRRFYSARLNLSFEAAHQHVEERTQDLAQTRPEFGNATNSVTFVGRRERIRGLFLDRRSFLHSYDPAQDDEDATILARILSAVVPVCEGINLQYYFSSIDPSGWGCGTKLPHNVTSLLGVMDGAASDLRCGLPWQGVEIHEPMRSLFILETTPRAMLGIMERNATIGRILRNGWAQLTLLNPNSSELLVYRDDQFQPYRTERADLPKVATSLDWYRGNRDHLGFAQIEK